MAVKEWVKTRNGWMRKKASENEEINIEKFDNWDGWFAVRRKVSNNNIIAKYPFSTKLQALKFAKKYMRSH